jgi:hypothetical protein
MNEEIENILTKLSSIEETTSEAIDNIYEKLGEGTLITTDNITEYIVTPSDDENIVISKTENGGISIKLVKIGNSEF